MDQISLTELRRFYFGPTLAESILYGYDCLLEFFGWNGSAERKNVEPRDPNSLNRIESIEALENNIAILPIKSEQENFDEGLESSVNESYGKELVVASMSNDPSNIHHSKRCSKASDIIEETIKENQTVESLKESKFGHSSKSPTKLEAKPEIRRTKRPSNDIRKSSSIIVEELKANINGQKNSNQSSTEQKVRQSSIHPTKTDILPIKSSRELQKTINALRKISDIKEKGTDQITNIGFVKPEVPTTNLKSDKRASDTSTSEFISFESSGEKKRSSKDLRKLSSLSLSKGTTSQNSQFKSCHSGSNHRMSLADSKETTPQRPTTSPTSGTRNGPSLPSPQTRRSSSSRPHSSPRDPKVTSAMPHQSRNRPQLTATRWAIARVNEFDDGAKTYEILPDATKLLTSVESFGQTPLDILRRMQKLQKSQPVPELTTTEVIFATLPGGHTISYKSDTAKSR